MKKTTVSTSRKLATLKGIIATMKSDGHDPMAMINMVLDAQSKENGIDKTESQNMAELHQTLAEYHRTLSAKLLK